MSLAVAASDGQDDVVLGHRQCQCVCAAICCELEGAGGRTVLPVRCVGLAPHHFVVRTRRCIRRRGPGHGGVVVQAAGFELYILWNGRRGGQRSERGSVQSSNTRHVWEVVELDQIAELNAIFYTNDLMLMIKILAPLREADAGKSFTVERGVVATTTIAIQAENHGWLQQF